MIKHKKIYADFFNLSPDEPAPCERCLMLHLMKPAHGIAQATDIHHIDMKGMGGSAGKDCIENLVGLCRKCHDNCHNHSKKNARIKKWAADLEARKIVIRKYLFQEL